MSRRATLLVSLAVGLAAVAAIAIWILTAGPGAAPRYELRLETSGPALSSADAEKLASVTDISALASVTSTDAVTMRSGVLSDLRTRGELGQRAADLLTEGFPERAAAVPVLVRACAVDGIDAILVVEAFGSDGGDLIHKRLWVFDRASGAILRAASFR